MIKKHNARWLICILLMLSLCFGLLAGCEEAVPTVNEDPPPDITEIESTPQSGDRFDQLLDELFAEIAVSDSITLNYFIANPSRFGIEGIAPTFGEVTSPETIIRDREENRTLFERLMEFQYGDLRADQKIIYDILIRNLGLIELMDGKDDYSYYLSAIRPTTGIQAQLPILLAEFNFRTAGDIEIYLQLLGDTQRYFGELIEFERERSRLGFFMSEANTDEVIANCESFLENRDDNLLITIFNDIIDSFDGLSSEQREQFKERNHDLVLNNVLTAYDMLLAAMRELRGQGANQGGLASLPDGGELAAAYLRHKTGSDRTPEQVEILLQEEMDKVLGTMRAFFENPMLLEGYFSGTLGAIPDAKPIIFLRILERNIERDFPSIGTVGYMVREVNESLQEFVSPAFYLVPALDSFLDNVIYINPAKISDNLSLYTTLAHEGFPGHLYQRVFFLQQSPHPLRTLLSHTGYTEGWATYVEMISYFYAGLEEDEARLMQYSQKYNILLITQIDLGVNALGWDISQVISYLRQLGIEDSSVGAEIFQMVTRDPLSYLPYCLGYIEFELMREEAERALGNRFIPMEFHRFLLEIGPAPFSLIREHMQVWIQTQ